MECNTISTGLQYSIVVLRENRDGKLVKSIHPKIDGRLRLAHEQNQQISVTTEVIRYDESVAVVKSVTTTMKGSLLGIDLASLVGDHTVGPVIIELEVTRAIARALQFAECGAGKD